MLSSLTIRGWPRRIAPSDPFPHPFRRSFEQLGLTGREEPCLLYSPRLRFGRDESTAKLLVWAGHRLACLDARRGGVVTTVLSLDQVHEVEWGQELLEAWLRLAAQGPGGRSVIRVEFNAVGLELYKPIADTARSMSYTGTRLSIHDQQHKLAPLLSADYRFVGFGKQALLSGVEFRRQWFQPRVPGLFGRDPGRMRIPALLLMVTQAELILVQEQAMPGGGMPYGTVWRCLPLRSIRSVVLVPEPARGALSVRVALPEGSEVRADVEPASEGPLRAFLRQTDPLWGELAPTPPPTPSPLDAPEEAPPP